jgi:hypothetical protein
MSEGATSGPGRRTIRRQLSTCVSQLGYPAQPSSSTSHTINSQLELSSAIERPHRPPPLPPRKPAHLQLAHGARVSYPRTCQTLISCYLASKYNCSCSSYQEANVCSCTTCRTVYAVTTRRAITMVVASSHWHGTSNTSQLGHNRSARCSTPFRKSCEILYSSTPLQTARHTLWKV